MGVNLRKKNVLTREPELRQALEYAIDKQHIINLAFNGFGEFADGPIPSSMLKNQKAATNQYNPQKAKAIVDKYRAELTAPLDFIYGDWIDYHAGVVEYIRQCLEAVGLKVRTRGMDRKIFEELQTASWDLVLFRWFGDTGDADNFLRPSFTKSYTNFTNYNNQYMEELLDQSRSIKSIEGRNKIYGEIQNILIRDKPWIPLCYPQNSCYLNPKIKGAVLSPLGHFEFHSMWLENF
jgi:ABC-type transport system substrate-binding protein